MDLHSAPSALRLEATASERPQASITFRVEPSTDFAATVKLLARAFPRGYDRDAAYLAWSYSRASARPALVVAAEVDGAKIGQMVFIPHDVDCGGERQLLGLTVDFFVLPEHRTGPLAIKLTRAAMRCCREQGFTGIYGIPNAASLPVVSRFMKGTQTQRLELRGGFALPLRRRSVHLSADVEALDGQRLTRELAPFVEVGRDRRIWTPETLVSRLHSPLTRFALHASADALAISCRHAFRNIPFTLLCGFLARPGRSISRGAMGALIAAACAHHSLPSFVYLGVNADLEHLPGVPLPERFRPSPLTILAMNFNEGARLFTPQRYELIDFDIV